MQERYVGEMGCLMKEQITNYRQHIRQLHYLQLSLEEQRRTCGDRKFHLFHSFKTLKYYKSLGKFHEGYFTSKVKPLLSNHNSY